MNTQRILIYGYGNVGREDDGLGIYFTEAMQAWMSKKKRSNFFFDTNYQLNIEDSFLISTMDVVLFVDASRAGNSFNLIKLSEKNMVSSLTTHNVNPELLLFLCKKLYNKSPQTYLLTIKGSKWGFGLGLSQKAKKNLSTSLSFVKKISLFAEMFNPFGVD